MAERSAQTAAARQKAPTNPWMLTLGLVVVVAFLLGVILFIIGNIQARDFQLVRGGDPGLGQIVWGGALMGLGLSALFPLLAAQAVIWHLRATATTR